MIRAHAVKKAKAPLTPFNYEEKLGPNDVLVEIAFCGICHSDVHLADGDWGEVFPLVPGHEIIGTVEQAGKKTKLKPGTLVGIGWQCDSCATCEHCKHHEEVFCAKNQATCVGHYGGFATHVVANERFAIPIPKGMDLASTAPLLCGGVTVYTPLRRYAKKGSKVAVIAIGGLGHLAVQFAHAMGCHVTAISTRKDKEREAKAFGADEFLTTMPAPGSFDLIINTAHATIDMKAYLKALKPKGVFCQVGAAGEPLVVPAMGLIGGAKAVAGSAIGHPSTIKEMLAFAKKHGVKAKVEVLPMGKATEALDRTRKGLARYRMVLAQHS